MKYALMHGIILNGKEDMQPIEGKMILVDGDQIEAITDEDETLLGYSVIDLRGHYIMPGLINLHVHLPASGKPKKKQPDTVKLVKFVTAHKITQRYLYSVCAISAKMQMFSGVTTIRTMGGVQDYDSQIRDAIYKGEIDGPRILAGNMAVSVPGGHMAGSLAYEATSAEEAAGYVKEILKGNPDIIKLMITGGVLDAKVKGEPGVLKMPPEYVKAACDEAHKAGLNVAAHVESPEGVKVALENGVDTIEHGACPDDDIIRLFKETGACHVATLSPALPYALFDKKVSHITDMEQYNGNIVFEGIVKCANKCLEEGIPVGLGTDTGCPYITHYDMWRELNYFHKYCNVSNAFAIHTATEVNARIAGIDHITGTIEPGKCADFVITKENPLDSITALRNPVAVMARGKLYNKIAIKKMPKVETELDKFI